MAREPKEVRALTFSGSGTWSSRSASSTTISPAKSHSRWKSVHEWTAAATWTGTSPDLSSCRSAVVTTGEVWTRSKRSRDNIGHDAPMTSVASVAVWAAWRLHADALVSIMEAEGLPVRLADDPVAARGLLVAGAALHDHTTLLEHRRRGGRSTIIWGGTLPVPRVDALREAGAAAYVTMLQPAGEVVDVVQRVLAGQEVPWPQGPGPLSSLTPREHEVAVAYLERWADHPRSEVASLLGISERTLKVHIANIRAKAGHRGTATREGLHRTLIVREWLD